MTIRYRKEIDGLRSIAVVPVVLFHAGISLLSGGFVGVDIFFVISGYLITSIIVQEVSQKKFSLLRFYERRARRILPALSIVMLACTPFAFKSMLPDFLENYGQSLIATTLFANNVLLWLTSGYFALESEFKPLIHTWSLGVEEQYYFLFPLLVLILWRADKRWLLVTTITTIAIASLWYASVLTYSHPDASFYLLPTRAWELMIGSMSAFTAPYLLERQEREKRWQHELAAVLGLLLILYAIFTFNKHTPVPGLPILLPTIGAALIINFASSSTFIGKLLGLRLPVFIGLLSYSLYLWHQPIFALIRLRSLAEPNLLIMLAGALLSVLLAFATWRFVETPFRDRRRYSTKVVLTFNGVTAALILIIGTSFYFTSGFLHLRPELNTDVKAAGRRLNAIYNERPFQYKNAEFNDPTKINILVWGNSFARDFINAGLENGYFSRGELSYSDYVPSCMRTADDIKEPLRTRVSEADYLIYGTPTVTRDCWENDFSILRELGAQYIIVIGTKNFGWNINAVMLLNEKERYQYRAPILTEYAALNREQLEFMPPDYFVNLLGIISDDQGRVPVFTPNRKIISQDRMHLTKEGARYIGQLIFENPLLQPLK